MKRRTTLVVLILLFAFAGHVDAQKNSKKSKKNKQPKVEATPQQNNKPSNFGVATPKDMFEIGVNAGYLFVSGDVSPDMNFAGGIHFRKAADYIFSFRGDFIYGQASGMDEKNNRSYTNDWMSGSLLGILSLNAVRFNKDVRRFNYYVLAGGGVNNFETRYYDERNPDALHPREISPHVTVGAGIAIRLSPRFNVSVEHQASSLFGRRADFLDGYEKQGNVRTPFRDFMNYTRVGINFNVGDTKKLAEPLYWINPLRNIVQRMDGLEKKQELDLVDTDGDGVLDLVDQEPETPADVPVDTKGRTLDSDRDGVPDYKDLEPYNPPRPGEVVNSQGIVENRELPEGAGGGVTEDRVREIVKEELEVVGLTGGNSVAEWFLPMIHFSTDQYTIKYSDYGTLSGIAQMMKSNPKLRLVVKGFTDETGSEAYNDALSYDRAREVIDHLVNNYGIGRGRLILHWGGQSQSLVPTVSSFVNRRVEFKVASDEVEMDPPEDYQLKSRSGY